MTFVREANGKGAFRPSIPTLAPGKGGVAGWSPLDLGSDLLHFFDPAASGTAFEDSARTTPASLGGSLGALNDRATSNYVAQATALNRPLLSDDNGIRHINPDGSNDSLAANANLVTSLPLEIYMAIKYPFTATARHLNFRTSGTVQTVLLTSTDTLSFSCNGANIAAYAAPNVWNGLRLRIRSGQTAEAINFAYERVAVATGVALEEMKIADGIGFSFPSAAKLGPIVIAKELSAANRALVSQWVQSRLKQQGLYVAEGDSITAFSATSKFSYAHRVVQNLAKPIGSDVAAVASSLLSHLSARAATLDASLANYPTRQRKVLSVLTANDLASGMSTATFLSNLAAYLDARRAAGWYVILCTILPRTTAGFNTDRNTCNTTLRAWIGTHCDAVCDLAADATMGPDAAASDTNLYYDGTHPTSAGQDYLEPLMRASLDAAFA